MIRAQLDELGIPFSSGRGAVKAVSEQIGWDSRGRITDKCDLPQILKEWQNFKLGREWMFTPDSMLLNPAEVVPSTENLAGVVDNSLEHWNQLGLFD